MAYFTFKSQVPLGPGQTLGFTKGRGYYAKGAAGPATDPLTTQATTSVEAALAPLLAALERQRTDAREQAAREQQRLGDYYKWAAGEAKSIGPQIQGVYNQAGQTTASYGKGFSLGMQAALGQSADQGNALLAQNGAPEGQKLGGNIEAAGNALYGLEGALPAQALSQQGAAFASAAAQLPSTAAGVGGQALADLMAQGKQSEKQFADAILEIEQKRPGLIQEALQELRDLQLQERNQVLKEQAFEFETGRKIRNDEFSQAARTEQLAQGRDRIAIQRYNARLAKLRADRSFQQGLDRLGIQEEGLRLRAAELEAKRQTKDKKKGYTPSQLSKLRGTAGTIARNAYRGIDEDGDGKFDGADDHPPIGYQEALRVALDEGVPLAVVLTALNRYYKRGERGRPRLDFYQRQNARKAARAKPSRG